MKTVVIVSGYFNPIHAGHINLLEGARELGDHVVVILNNDKQQLIKKGKIIMTEDERLRVVRALRLVDDVVLSIDEEPPIINTLEQVAQHYSDAKIIFGNGGDRDSKKRVPETAICEQYNIEMHFDVGGTHKANSSHAINVLRGAEEPKKFAEHLY